MNKIITLSLSLVVLSCAHIEKAAPGSDKVKISSSPAASNCKEVGSVSGKSNSDNQEHALEGARTALKNKAAQLGGNYVALETNNSTLLPGFWKARTEILLGGTAYLCK